MSAAAATLADLDRVAVRAAEAQKAARIAQHLATPGADPEEVTQAAEYAALAAEAAGSALADLVDLGAARPNVKAPTPIPLEKLDTPDARALLAGLRDLLPVAERLDADRGRVLPEGVATGPSDSRGTDLADTLAALIARLATEVHGARGRE